MASKSRHRWPLLLGVGGGTLLFFWWLWRVDDDSPPPPAPLPPPPRPAPPAPKPSAPPAAPAAPPAYLPGQFEDLPAGTIIQTAGPYFWGSRSLWRIVKVDKVRGAETGYDCLPFPTMAWNEVPKRIWASAILAVGPVQP